MKTGTANSDLFPMTFLPPLRTPERERLAKQLERAQAPLHDLLNRMDVCEIGFEMTDTLEGLEKLSRLCAKVPAAVAKLAAFLREQGLTEKQKFLLERISYGESEATMQFEYGIIDGATRRMREPRRKQRRQRRRK